MGKDQRPALRDGQSGPERDFWGEVDASYATYTPLGRLVFWVLFLGAMGVIWAVAGTLIYGSPLGPLREKAPQPSASAGIAP